MEAIMIRVLGFLFLAVLAAQAEVATRSGILSVDHGGFPNGEIVTNNLAATSIPGGSFKITNGLSLIQGAEFLSAQGDGSNDKLLNDGNYFIQLTWHQQPTFDFPRFRSAFSVHFEQSFVVSNAAKVIGDNTKPSLNQITKADAIGLYVSPMYQLAGSKTEQNSQLLYLGANLGGNYVFNADENVKDGFLWENSGGLIMEIYQVNHRLRATAGYMHTQRLEEDRDRSVLALMYGYELELGTVLLSTEINGSEHDNSEVRVNIGLSMSADRFFKALGGLFKPKEQEKKDS